jgi:hypothetical protein
MPRGELEAGAPVVTAFGCSLSRVGDYHYFTTILLLLLLLLLFNIITKL